MAQKQHWLNRQPKWTKIYIRIPNGYLMVYWPVLAVWLIWCFYNKFYWQGPLAIILGLYARYLADRSKHS